MILSCPSCSTRYLVDPLAIGADGRQVRCARCGHVWRQAPPPAEEAAAAEEEAPILRGPARARPLPPGSNLPALRQPPRRRAGGLAWLALALVIAGGVAALFVFRQQFVEIWPPAAQLYRLAGLDRAAEPGQGLDIRGVKFERKTEAGRAVLLVTGQVVNPTKGPQPAPRLRVAIGDEAKKELVHWTVPLAKEELAPGEATDFSTRLPDPPANARSLSVTFLPEG
jgi:predicted Zn finger-like uncharacterized protein